MMSKAPKPQQPSKTPPQALGGLKPASGFPLSGLGGTAHQGGSLGASQPTSGLFGGSGSHANPSHKGGAGHAANASIKPGQKPGGKPTGVPRRTAG